MENPFYKQIKDEEAVRIAKNVLSDRELKVRAECTRIQFYFGIFSRKPTARTFVVTTLLYAVILFWKESVFVVGLVCLLVLEVNWLQVKLGAMKELREREKEREGGSEDVELGKREDDFQIQSRL